MLTLPSSWSKIEAEQIYQTIKGPLVSFSQTQIKLAKRYDVKHKHIKAIEKGEVSPRGNIGLVPSEKEGYHLKSKVLGKGGNYRFHGQYIYCSILNIESNNDQQVEILTVCLLIHSGLHQLGWLLLQNYIKSEEENKEAFYMVLYFTGLMTEH
ncbi:hypothetical protein [Okeania sp.]|uniref:hypothetical protein n=1 Tax=Okeania sp. TaxID=3100323 RepID=UPI002B4AE7AE|nr:hypothetical protein [Okeania sp.]MEB3343741.1 hypothetical protein [Okeania sp.]